MADQTRQKHSFTSFRQNALARPSSNTSPKTRSTTRTSPTTSRTATSPSSSHHPTSNYTLNSSIATNHIDALRRDPSPTSPSRSYHPVDSTTETNLSSSSPSATLQSRLNDLELVDSVSFTDNDLLGSLNIVVIAAQGLRAADVGGKSDPYVLIKLGQEEFRSRTVRKSINPAWNQRIKLYVYKHSPQHLDVSVWDEDTGKVSTSKSFI